MDECSVCERIELTKAGKNPFFVKELETGFVVLGDVQYFKGYALLLCKQHATELHFLEKGFRDRFLQEMALVAEAVYNVFEPDKLNYELLGVGAGVHMHWHIFPRRAGDTPSPGPVWRLQLKPEEAACYKPAGAELEEMKKALREELERLLKV